MHQPNNDVNLYLDAWKRLYEAFGKSKAGEIWRWAIYYTFKDNRDFFNVLNEHPDVLIICKEITEDDDYPYPYMIGNVWGTPYPEDK